MLRIRTVLLALVIAALAACAGNDAPPAQPEGATTQPAAETLVTGDGSNLCFETGDLPPGYLPVAGQNNTSNARDHVFDDPAISARVQEAYTASWSVLPQGGASLGDKTADCSVYLFNSAEIDDIYAWYADGYPSRSQPAPIEEAVPAGAPGESPRMFHFAPNEFSGREAYTYVFRFRNVIAKVSADAAAGEVTAADATPLAQTVLARLEAAG